MTLKQKIAYAFPKSLPVLFGYIFLGIAFGLTLQQNGFGTLWAFGMSVTIFAGSMQFVMAPLMAAATSLLTIAVTTLFVNSRHLFYGLSFIESFNKMKEKPYMIFALTDETYSVLCGCRNEDPEEKYRDAWFFIALFDQSYWIIGSLIGALLGSVIPFDMTGIDFSMTALFVVILVDQIRNNIKVAGPAAGVGLVVALVCLGIFGTSNFLLPTLLITVLIVGTMTAVTGKTSKAEAAVEKEDRDE